MKTRHGRATVIGTGWAYAESQTSLMRKELDRDANSQERDVTTFAISPVIRLAAVQIHNMSQSGFRIALPISDFITGVERGTDSLNAARCHDPALSIHVAF